MKVMVTGAAGFIGSSLCRQLSAGNELIGIDSGRDCSSPKDFLIIQTDLTDFSEVDLICNEYSPDVIIHCAGIAHQKIGTVDLSSYLHVNSEATENHSRTAPRANSDVSFIFLSSVSLYGEDAEKVSRKGAKTLRGEEYSQMTPVESSIENCQARITKDKRTIPITINRLRGFSQNKR